MFLACTALFAWELGWLSAWLWSPPRPPATGTEIAYSIAIALLLSGDAGLIAWRLHHGSCPVGMRRATGLAGTLGAIALLCPVCLALPFTLFGVAVALSALAPILPLLRLIALVLLGSAGWMLLTGRRS